MVSSLLGTVRDSNFSVGVVQVIRDSSRMLNKEVSTVIVGCTLCMYICVTFISVI